MNSDSPSRSAGDPSTVPLGPLDGVRVIELAGLGALPFCSLKLADMGATVIRVDRAAEVEDNPEEKGHSSWDRGRLSIGVDLKNPEGVEAVLRLAEGADVVLESFRPGVVERLGVGPDAVHARNPKVVYGRLTGWGQNGPLSHAAGHSLNYESLTGVIRACGPAGGPPVPLLQLLGDFAGGGMNLAYGVVCALFRALRTGEGQVVDAGMVDGVMSLAGVFYGMAETGFHTDEMHSNLFDGGAPFYNVYETSDAKFVSVAPIEPHFYELLLDKIGLAAQDLPAQWDQARWPELRDRFAEVFATKSRAEWTELLEGTDACFAPVLTFTEATTHEHASRAFVDPGSTELLPIPRLDKTPGTVRPSPKFIGEHTDTVLAGSGFSPDEIASLRAGGAIR